MESALVVLVPAVEALVASCRLAFDPSASEGMPAHVTVLYPFKPAEEITAEDRAALFACFAALPSFGFELSRVCEFPGVLYLAPEPAIPFATLTRSVAQRFPAWPPYRGVVAEPTPHLTVGLASDPAEMSALRFSVERSVRPALPVSCSATAVSLFRKRDSRWESWKTFPLSSSI